MVVVEHVVGVVGAGAVAGIWGWSRGGKGVPWRREGTVFLCMLPRVPVQQVSYTLAAHVLSFALARVLEFFVAPHRV